MYKIGHTTENTQAATCGGHVQVTSYREEKDMAKVRLYLDLVLLRISLRNSVIFFDQRFTEKS